MDLDAFLASLQEDAEEHDDATNQEVTLLLEDVQPPGVRERLARLDRLGLLSGDVIMSIVAQAPIDPVNMVAAAMEAKPGGWTFSAIDCSMVRVLAKDSRGRVAAVVRIDLMDDSVTTFVANQARQLTVYKTWEPQGPDAIKDFCRTCDDAVAAASRETTTTRETQ